MKKVEAVLGRLQHIEFKANLRKSFFMAEKVEYLGFILSKDGVEPQPAKIHSLRRIKTPKNAKELRRNLGMFNFY